MRLTCPNCGAQYEVPDDVIPDAGRDVQCSNCGDTWFQQHPDHPHVEAAAPADPEAGLSDTGWDAEAEEDEDLGADAGDGAARSPDTPPPARRELDPAVADVLRQEAAQEARARAAEGGGLESQPDLGLEDAHSDTLRRSREARERMARLRGLSTETPEPAAEIDSGARRTLLPDIEEINSSLRADADDTEPVDPSSDFPEATQDSGGGFRRGFRLAVVVALVLLLIYVYAPRIAALLPATGAVLADYVGFVDGLRAGLGDLVAQVMRMAGTGAGGGGN